MATGQKQCFVIMPFTAPSASNDYAEEHFTEVYEDLFVPAVELVGFHAVRADTTQLSRNILADLLAMIESTDVVLCDLSTANPNVLFELGWAFRADKPCVLVKDELTSYIFDLQHTHVTTYQSGLRARQVATDIKSISELIGNTAKDETRRWSMAKNLGLELNLQLQEEATGDSSTAALLDVREELRQLRSRLEDVLVLQASGIRRTGGSLADERSSLQLRNSSDEDLTREKELLSNALRESRGNVAKAAALLGMSRQALYRRLEKHELGPY